MRIRETLREKLAGSVASVAERGRSWLERRLVRPTPATAPSPPPTPEPLLAGLDLARSCLEAAARALLAQSQSPAQVFHALRMELNRLEQGGLSQTRPAPGPAAAQVTHDQVIPRSVASILSQRSRSAVTRTWRAFARAA